MFALYPPGPECVSVPRNHAEIWPYFWGLVTTGRGCGGSWKEWVLLFETFDQVKLSQRLTQKLSLATKRQAASTGERGSEWFGGSILLFSSGSNQISLFQVSRSHSFLINTLTFKWETWQDCEFNNRHPSTCTTKFCAWFPSVSVLCLQGVRLFRGCHGLFLFSEMAWAES